MLLWQKCKFQSSTSEMVATLGSMQAHSIAMIDAHAVA